MYLMIARSKHMSMVSQVLNRGRSDDWLYNRGHIGKQQGWEGRNWTSVSVAEELYLIRVN